MNDEEFLQIEEIKWLNLAVLRGLSIESGLSELREEALSKSAKGSDVTFTVSVESGEDSYNVTYDVGVKYKRLETTKERQARRYITQQDEFNQLQKDKREYQRLKLKFEGETNE